MRYVAAYLLAVLGGNDNPSESDIKKILSSVGIDADPECLKKVVGELRNKNVNEVMTAGHAKLATMPTASCAVPTAATAVVTAEQPSKVAETKEEPASESEDEDMGFGLFD